MLVLEVHFLFLVLPSCHAMPLSGLHMYIFASFPKVSRQPLCSAFRGRCCVPVKFSRCHKIYLSKDHQSAVHLLALKMSTEMEAVLIAKFKF